MNDKELQQAFLQFLAKKSGAKNQQELEKYVQSLGEDGLKQAYDEFTKVMQSQAQKAAHGAKLQYFRNLKHKCGENEELVFYKKGGSVECGCKGKVMEKGGEVKKASTGTAIDDFKKKKQQEKGTTYDPKTGKMRPATKEELEQRARNRKDATQGKGEGNYVQPNAQNSKKVVKKAGAGCIAEFKSQRRFAKGGKPKVSSEKYKSMDGDPSNNYIERKITFREPTMKNDTTYSRTIYSKYGDNRLFRTSSNSDTNKKQYKKDEESFKRAKAWSK